MTQARLGELVGVAGPTRISLWESGAAEPRPNQLRRLSDVLGVPISKLLNEVHGDRDLRRLRQESGLTIEELAARIFVAAPTIKRWEQRLVYDLPSKAPVSELGVALGISESQVVAALQASSRD